MIDFRYHLVSIVAVFLALAIGIVIGSTSVLKGAVLSGLQKTSAAEKSRIDSLYAQNGQLKQQLNAAESFASASEHVLLDGLLAGQRVVLVEAPGAPGSVVSGVQNALTTAGATVTGQVQFQTQFFSTGAASDLDTLNRQLTPAGVTLRAGSPQAAAGQLIASAILTKDTPDHPLTGNADSADQTILNGYAAGGYLSTSPRAGRPCHPGCRDYPGHPAVHQRRQRRQPDPGDAGPAAEPGGQRHRGGRPGDRLRRGQRDRRDAGRRPRRPPEQRGQRGHPERPDRGGAGPVRAAGRGQVGQLRQPARARPRPARARPRSRPRPRPPR